MRSLTSQHGHTTRHRLQILLEENQNQNNRIKVYISNELSQLLTIVIKC